MDTDSLFYLDEKHSRFVEEIPEIFGDKPRQMKEELGKDKYGIFKAKEFHIVYSYEDDGKGISYKAL